MSASIIKQMRAGEYCYEQIEILLAQRRRVKEVIRQAENPSARSTPTSPETPPTSSGFRPSSENIIASAGLGIATSLQQAVDENLPMSPAGTPTNTPSESASSSPVRKRPSKKAKCNFQVCHSCRPFFQDRLPMNVNAVLNNEIPAVTEVEVEQLPVKDSNIIRNIGLREPSAETSIRSRGETHRDGTYEDEQTEDSTPTSVSSAWTDTSDEMTGGDVFPCPGAGRCPVHSPTEGCAYDHGFDDGHRALNHGFTADVQSHYADRSNSPHGHYDYGSEMTTDSPHGTSSTGSSISLPDALRVPLTPPTPSRGTLGFNFTEARGFSKKAGKAATICGDISDERRRSLGHYRFGMFGNDSNSSLGSEVEVQGGVALTEEAVEMRTPDIVDQDD